MAVSFANVNGANMELTPARVTYGGVDLGGTLSNVKVSMSYGKADIKADQFGDTVLDRRVKELKITIETELAEVNVKDNWKVVFPNMDLVGSGLKGGNWTSKVGESDLALAKTLLLHPLSLPNADLSRDFNIYKATAEGVSEITYSPSGQAKLKIKWNVYPDTSVVPARFMFYGDPSIGVTVASAGAPSFTGTGNGTVTSVAVFNGFGGTKTETITIACVGQTAGNVFSVTGSLTGPMGVISIAALAASTANFVSGQIAFTLTQGATQFVVGDSFTVATVASNYA